MREATFGDVLSPIRDAVRLDDGSDYPTVGILSYGRGLFARPVVKGADVSYSTYYRIRTDQFIYSKLFAWEGALSVVPPMYDGFFVSQEFPTFEVELKLALPSYLGVLTTWPGLWDRVRLGESGMGGRRKRVRPDRLASVAIPLPSLREQARIVDLIETMDQTLGHTETMASRAGTLVEALVEEWAEHWTGDRALLSSLATMGSGPSWKATEETSIPADGGHRVLGISNTPPGGVIRFDDAKYVSGLPERTVKLTDRSLLMIRTNGNRERIGNVYRVPSEAQGMAFSAFQIGLHFGSVADASFAYWMLSRPSVQRQMSEAASGTTGLGNLAIGWLKRLEVPWPSNLTARKDLVGRFDSALDVLQSLRHQAAMLKALRSALLEDLLAGHHDIPDSYDRLLEHTS